MVTLSRTAANAPGSTPAWRTRTQRALASWRSAAPALVLAIMVLALWQAVTAVGLVSPYLLPTPQSVAQALWDGVIYHSPVTTFGGGRLSVWLSYGLVTLYESLAGFALGSLVALPLGYGIARSELVASTLQPYLAASQAVPAVALAPLLSLWLGYDTVLPVVALCALIVFFPTVVNTALGIRTLDRSFLDAARMDGAHGWAMIWHIEGPLALPSVLAGLRTSLTLSVTGAVVGEFVVSGSGLGGLLEIARGENQPALVFATLLMLAPLAMLLYGAARVAERKLSYLEEAR